MRQPSKRRPGRLSAPVAGTPNNGRAAARVARLKPQPSPRFTIHIYKRSTLLAQLDLIQPEPNRGHPQPPALTVTAPLSPLYIPNPAAQLSRRLVFPPPSFQPFLTRSGVGPPTAWTTSRCYANPPPPPPLHPHALCPAPSFVASSPPPLYPCSRRLKYTSGSRHPLRSGLWSIPTRLGLVAQGHDLRMKGQPDRVKELKVFARQFLTPRVKCFRLESARCNRDEAVGRRIRRPFSELAPAAA